MSKQPEPPRPKTQVVLDQVNEVKEIMHNNIDVMLQNHEKLDVLQEKTETMSNNAKTFKKQATTIKRHMWWRNCKLQIIIALVIIAILAVVLGPIIWKFAKN